MDSQVYFGIDLGTTNTVVSKGTILENGDIETEIIEIEQFDKNKEIIFDYTLPSVLYVDENDKEYVGSISKSIKLKDSKKVLANTKRYIGTDENWKLKDKTYNAKDVAKIILKTCRESMIKHNNDKPVEKVTITVPASFNTDQIKDTKDAALEIGFKDVSLIPEPTSALIDFINEKLNHLNIKKSARVLIFDLGGGTCDIAVVDVLLDGKKLEFCEIAIGRYNELGGIDFDNTVSLFKFNEFLDKNNIEYDTLLQTEKDEMIRSLRIFAERAKESISMDVEKGTYFGQKYKEELKNFYKNKNYSFSIDKDEYDFIIKEFFEYTKDNKTKLEEEKHKNIISPIINTLNDYDIDLESIEYLFLTGGMTKYETIREEIRKLLKLTNEQIIRSSDCLSSVSKGAVIYNYYETTINSLEDTTTNKKFEFKRVLAEAIMIDVKEGLPVVIIKSNQEVPYKGTLKGVLKTTSPSGIDINLYAGIDEFDSKMRIQRKYKAYFKTPKKPKTLIDIEFSIDKDKYLTMYILVDGEKIELKQEVDFL